MLLYLVGEEFAGSSSLWLRLMLGPALLTLTLAFGALRMILIEAGAIWTALFWFRVSSGIFLGIGSLSPLVIAPELRLYMEQFYFFSDDEIARVNLLFATSVLTVLVSANIYVLWRGHLMQRGAPSGTSNSRAMLRIALVFLAIGGPVKYLLSIPSNFGLLDYVLPGSIALFGNFTYPALFFLTAWSREHARHMLPLAVALLALEMFLGLLLFSKEGVLTPLMIFLLASMRLRITMKGLAWMAGLIVACFVTIIPIVIDARIEMGSRFQDVAWSAGLGERIEILTKALYGEYKAASGTDQASSGGIAMVRISYVNAATFAMSLHDRGQAGDTLSHALAAFVPRFLWPDKPMMTQVSIDFNVLATGIASSASSPTIFGEAYWNFGWLGLLFVAAPMGLLLGVLSRYAINVFRDGTWLLFPVVILGMHLGHRVDGHIVADLVGAPVIIVSLHLVLSTLGRSFAGTSRGRSAPLPEMPTPPPPQPQHRSERPT